uniref:Uncharacterized protein n=1 Tax=Melanopsichium pennsylvanicum 4 TaxID=1398559 RepID=A0A077R5P4_9BASI|nr:uncharacterized protein BN887_06155 [Melanopsichium pennsylvanicum 4]
MNSKLAPATRAADGGGGVIKTCSDRATLLRRLQKLKGLRAGGRGRVIDKIQSEIERPLKGKDDMVDEGEEEDMQRFYEEIKVVVVM